MICVASMSLIMNFQVLAKQIMVGQKKTAFINHLIASSLLPFEDSNIPCFSIAVA
jgi:hypothetical protein